MREAGHVQEAPGLQANLAVVFSLSLKLFFSFPFCDACFRSLDRCCAREGRSFSDALVGDLSFLVGGRRLGLFS